MIWMKGSVYLPLTAWRENGVERWASHERKKARGRCLYSVLTQVMHYTSHEKVKPIHNYSTLSESRNFKVNCIQHASAAKPTSVPSEYTAQFSMKPNQWQYASHLSLCSNCWYFCPNHKNCITISWNHPTRLAAANWKIPVANLSSASRWRVTYLLTSLKTVLFYFLARSEHSYLFSNNKLWINFN